MPRGFQLMQSRSARCKLGIPIVDNSDVQINPTGVYASTSDYAWAYLNAHAMRCGVSKWSFSSADPSSYPSYRYQYMLWFILALIALLYTVIHHARVSSGSFGAMYSRWSVRRRTLGSQKGGSQASRVLPSNGLIIMMATVIIAVLALCVVGPDYISPSTFVLNYGSTKKRALTSPVFTINKSFWSSGSRFGDMAFALLPLVVLLALKSPPVALLANRVVAQIYADKMAIFHRASAWLVWFITTIHVVLWTIQLFQDSYNGSSTWIALWTNYRFICGAAAYLFMCLVMVLSLRPIRKKGYEFFYISHVVLVILTLACSALHHPVLWWWIAAAAGLWALERIFRVVRLARINGVGKSKAGRMLGGQPYAGYQGVALKTGQPDSFGMQELKGQGIDEGEHGPFDTPYTDKSLPRLPSKRFLSQDSTNSTPDADYTLSKSQSGYFDDRRGSGYTDTTETRSGPLRDHDALARKEGYNEWSSRASYVNLAPPQIPVGYAVAQLLPSRTVRLTIRVAHPFRWAAGQSVLLYLPELSKFQSHPFTIVNNVDEEIVVLVKARKGLTKQLYELVRRRTLNALGIHARDKRVSLNSMRSGNGLQVGSIHLRALVDGPFGSACRVRWNEFSTILIICGGSGVSFGAAVCDYACRAIAHRRSSSDQKSKIQRVRFCWVAREYAEIAWVASQLKRCQDMVDAAQLEISIFVTNARAAGGDAFAPPKPAFAGQGQRRDSMDSVASDMSTGGPAETGPVDLDGNEGFEAPGLVPHNYADIIDLTNYEDEEDVRDPLEQQLSARIQQQGKVRRAKSRKVAKRASRATAGAGGQSRPSSTVYPPAPRSQRLPSQLAYDAEAEEPYAAAALGRHGAPSPGNEYPSFGPNANVHPSGRYEDPYDQPQPVMGRRHQPSPLASQDTTPYGSSYNLSGSYAQQPQYPQQYQQHQPPYAPQQGRYNDHYATGGGPANVYDPYASSPEPGASGSRRYPAQQYPSPAQAAGGSTIRPASRVTSGYSSTTSPPGGHVPLPNTGLPGGDSRRHSYRSVADSTYASYDPYSGPLPSGPYAGMGGGRGLSPAPSMMFDDARSMGTAADSQLDLELLARGSRMGSMVLLEEGSGPGEVAGGDAGLWIDQADWAAMSMMSEMARPGKPKLAQVLEEEVEGSQGRIIVASECDCPALQEYGK